jgi:uncharacterized membrane protein YedE/YeeE
MLHDQLPWYIGGPVLGLCVVAIRVLINGRLGVTGGLSEVVSRAGRRSPALDWRGWFAIGIVAGATVFALVAGGPSFHGYGWLTDALHGDARLLVAPILVVAGVLIGYGAKAAGGCTSGNGLSGTSMLSPASIAATATFFGTAIAVTLVLEALV